jgi:hypothetical protein
LPRAIRGHDNGPALPQELQGSFPGRASGVA